MLIEIHHSDRMRILFQSEQRLFEIALGHDSTEMDLFKTDMAAFLTLLDECRPNKILWDLRNLNLVLNPEEQEWTDENITQAELRMGIYKEAFLLRENDIIAETFVEQVMDEQFGKQIISATFSTYQQAVDWFNNAHFS